MSRFWVYRLADYHTPTRWRVKAGSDEYHRRTLVLPVPFVGWLVIALWVFDCGEPGCVDRRGGQP